MPYEIQLREVGSQPILSIRAVVKTHDLVAFFDGAVREMRAYLTEVVT